MKPAARTTIIALAIFVCLVAWLVAAIGIAGIWLNCIPHDPEYGCPTETAAWERTLGFVVAAGVLTVFVWLGTRRLTSAR